MLTGAVWWRFTTGLINPAALLMLPWGPFCPPGDICNVCRHFKLQCLGEGTTECSRWRPETLLNITQGTGLPPPQNVDSATLEKPDEPNICGIEPPPLKAPHFGFDGLFFKSDFS